MFPYVSSGTFLRALSINDRNLASVAKKKIAGPTFRVFGVPWDGGVTNRPGARAGPHGVRQASLMLCDGTHPQFHLSPLDNIIDHGDFQIPNASGLAAMRQSLEKQVIDLLANDEQLLDEFLSSKMLPVFLGGDHSITLSTFKAIHHLINRRKKNQNEEDQRLAVIHFDAHCDTSSAHFGEPSGHGTFMREAVTDFNLVDPRCLFQIGIRASSHRGANTFAERNGGMMFRGRDMRGRHSLEQLTATVVRPIKQRLAEHGNPPCYLTFDIDALDPSCAGGTGTPEPGGLTTHQALTLVEELTTPDAETGAAVNFVAMDLVEVAPCYDQAEQTSLVAAHIVWTFMSALLSSSGTFLRALSINDRNLASVAKKKIAGPTFRVFGVPWDGAVTNRPGARGGPHGVRQASMMLFDATHPQFDLSPLDNIIDHGDFQIPNASGLAAMRQSLEKQVIDLLANDEQLLDEFLSSKMLPVFLGGDHSITLSTFKAIHHLINRRKKNQNEEDQRLAVIHFDAHCDTWTSHFDEPSGHGTFMREAVTDFNLVDPRCLFQIGIRSSADNDANTFATRHGGMMFRGRDMRGRFSLDELTATVVRPIKQRLAEHGNPPCYLTFDIDALDPSCAGGTGTPEPGGLTTHQALTLVEELTTPDAETGAAVNFVAMDLVEVAPCYDQAEQTSLVAAHIVWTFMSGLLARHAK